MNLNSKNYVPILKWKRAERSVLSELDVIQKNGMMPLLEFVMPKPKSKPKDNKTDEEIYAEVIDLFKTKRMVEIPQEILDSWGKDPIFVDFTLLYPLEVKVEAIEKIIEESVNLGLKLVPVINFSDNQSFKATVLESQQVYGHEVCLRISVVDLSDINELNVRLERYLKAANVTEDKVHLLIDIKDDFLNYSTYFASAQKIKNIDKWKNFIFASGAFPIDMSECKFSEDNYIPRKDWLKWSSSITGENVLARVPTYADYGIRHPIYNETYQFLEATSSIKYTLENNWLIIKGKKRRYDYFLAGAKLLVSTKLFYKKEFSKGDAYIAEKAIHHDIYQKNPKVKGTGTTELWLKAGLSHHFALVFDQLSKLV